MITIEQKKAIALLLTQERHALGSWQKVATKVGANVATVSKNMQEESLFGLVSDQMWQRVGTSLGHQLSDANWVLVETMNTRWMNKYLSDAQQHAMFLAVSHKAGQGKSAGISLYRSKATIGTVFYLECKEFWSHKLFLSKLCQTVGLDATGLNLAAMAEALIDFFKQKAIGCRPVLILDEANKLSPASLRLIIPLYNELKGHIGLVIVGADDLEKHIKSGVRRSVRGYDELDSRLGRQFMHLVGATEQDVRAICAANGIGDAKTQKEIWLAMNPQQVLVPVFGRYEDLVDEDLRRLERLILDRRISQVQG
ncbi:ATP-binding protein [Spirosoma sp. SC4-14]|uniref:ATP-binding protein n=1 Tax=Spirosoma sp. SC4-14 TaxID=3128900 RepID=UPI0030CBADD5